jgi:hypothetical protein
VEEERSMERATQQFAQDHHHRRRRRHQHWEVELSHCAVQLGPS